MSNFADLRIAVVGTGSAGRRHARNLLKLGVNKLVLCSEFQGGGRYLEDLEQVPLLSSYDAVLVGGFDAVVIANASNRHVDYAKRALEHGFHVYLEKPIAVTAEEAAILLEINAVARKTVAIGYQHRFNPLLRKARDVYHSGELGQIVNVHCCMGEYLPNYHPDEDYRVGYAARADMGGGVLRTQIHDINYLHWICGEMNLLCATGGKVSALEIDVEDSATALLKSMDSVPISLHMDYLQKKPYRILEVTGSDGGLRWSYHDNELVRWDGAGNIAKYGTGTTLDRNQLFLDCMSDFLSCTTNGSAPVCGLEDGYRDMCVVDAIRARLDFNA